MKFSVLNFSTKIDFCSSRFLASNIVHNKMYENICYHMMESVSCYHTWQDELTLSGIVPSAVLVSCKGT